LALTVYIKDHNQKSTTFRQIDGVFWRILCDVYAPNVTVMNIRSWRAGNPPFYFLRRRQGRSATRLNPLAVSIDDTARVGHHFCSPIITTI